jgi:hypothetical protein
MSGRDFSRAGSTRKMIAALAAGVSRAFEEETYSGAKAESLRLSLFGTTEVVP